MKNLFFTAFIALTFIVNTQVLQVDNTLTPQQLVQNILAGEGVQISNVTFNGEINSIGSFTGVGTNLGFSAGLILTSGTIDNAVGPNNQGGSGTGNGTNGDSDIDIITNNQTFDASVLEFDFIPISDTIIFNYIFGSEEYMEYVNGGVNDGFGFFLSGPGINGTFSNNAVNLAIIPGTTQFVTIDDVNENVNGQFYINNEIPPGESIQYDGFTTPLLAVSQVQCGQTYHLKIVIADAGDGVFDSGVFLQAGSLSSTGVDISLKTVTGDTIIYEGCTNAEFVFTRPSDDLSEVFVVNYSLSGTAIQGEDYTVFPLGDSVIFNVDQDSVSLVLSTIGIVDANEGNETVIITATFISICGDTITKTKSLVITEEPIINALSNDPVLDCPNDSVIATIEALGGTPPYIYTWTNAQGQVVEASGDSLIVNASLPGTQTFSVHITDFCGFEFDKNVIVTLNPKPPLSLTASAPNANCLTPTVPLTAIGSGGLAPLTFTWSNGETGPIVNGVTSGNPTPIYTVTMKDACGDSLQAVVPIVFDPGVTLTVTAFDVNVQCPSNQVPITAAATGGFQPYTYVWSDNQTGQTVNVAINQNGTETYSVTATDNCGNTGTTTMNVILNQTLNINALNPISTYTCLATGEVSAAITGQTGAVNYSWAGPNTDTIPISNATSINQLTTGWYYLSIQDDVCNDQDSVFVDIIADPIAGLIYSEPQTNLPKTVTFINQSQNATNYEWNFGNGEIINVDNYNNVNSIYSEVGTYTVQIVAFNGPCTDTAKITFILLPDPIITPPNIFTPNGDTKNDVFTLNALYISELSLQIFNRWGNLMFEGDLTKPDWDGKTTSGKEAQEGVYFYKYKVTGLNGTVLEGQENVQLTR